MGIFADIQAARDYIIKRRACTPLVGVVLGSGLGAFTEQLDDVLALAYQEIPGFMPSGVAGHRGALLLGTLGGLPVAVLSGRVHYYEGHSMQQVTHPVRVLASLGIKHLLITNAAGAVNTDFAPGDFMVITDHLNMTGTNPLIGKNDERLGPRFLDMSMAYDAAGRSKLQQAAKKTGIPVRCGVYAGLSGPTYETPAEVRMLRTLGADAVGMSTVAEVIVANHAGLPVTGLSVITNLGAGLQRDASLSHDEVKAVGERVRGPLCQLLLATLKELL